MGTWGVEILTDDFARDIYDEYMEMYDEGISVSKIRNKIEEEYQDIDDSEQHIFYLALAKAQWECKALDNDILQKVKKIVDDGIGLDIWKEQDETLFNKRTKVLKDFLLEIETENNLETKSI